MSTLQLLGISLQMLAVIAALFLYRTLRLGTYMQASPYVFLFIGAMLLLLAPDTKSPWGVTITMLSFTLVIHAAVYYDLRKDKRG